MNDSLMRRYYLLTLLLFTSLCHTPTALAQETSAENQPPQLVGTYPLADGAFDTEIVFYFDKPLAPVDDPATLIQFDPPVPGTWTQGERFVALAVATDPAAEPGLFRAIFLPALRSRDGIAPAPINDVVFTNFQLTLNEATYGQIGVQSTQISLLFSADVTWEQLQQHLQVTDAQGNNVRYTCPQRGAITQHVITVPTVTTAPYTLHLSTGLTNASGTFQTKAPIQRELPPIDAFAFEKIVWQHESEDQDRLDLVLPVPLDYEVLAENLQLFVGDETSPITLTANGSGREKELSYRFTRPTGPNTTLRYQFSGTLEDIPALYAQTPLSGTLLLTRNPLTINYHNWESQGVEPIYLELYFNGTVDPETALKYLEFSPTVPNLTAKNGEHGGLALYGNWETQKNYGLIINPGLTDVDDSLQLEEALPWNVGQAPRRSGVGFAFETPYYFPRKTAGPLPIYGRNLRKAEATLYELFPSNLVKAIDQMESGKSPREFGYGLARKVAEHTIEFGAASPTLQEKSIPLEGFMPEDRKGIFGITLSPAYDYFDTKIIVWTDIGVLAHWQEDALLLYAHNLWDLSPIVGGKVTVYSSKHQVMGEFTTDATGVAHLENWDKELGEPKVAIVETEGDFTFLPLQARNDDPVAFTNAMPAFDNKKYDAFLYMDRNLYRPGETVHLRTLVRGSDGGPLTGAPLNVRFWDPKRGKHDYTLTLSNWGSGTLDVETGANWLTGVYQVEIRVPGDDTSLTMQSINIEEFVPNRLATSVKTEAPYWLPGEEHAITVHGDHLSGGPARDRKSGASVILEKRLWTHPQWSSYRFANDDPFKSDLQDLGEQTTDSDGNAPFSFRWQPEDAISFPVTATLRGEVFEAGGRSVSGRIQSTLFPTDVMVGLAASSAAAGNGVDIAVIAIHPDGRPAPVESVQVTLEKKQWRYFVRRYASHNEANWNDNFVVLGTHTVALTEGQGTLTLPVPEGYGNYRVKVSRDQSPQYATQSFYTYRGQIQLEDASRPSLIELTSDKKNYTIGETATVQITSPFDGNAIAVLQHEGLERMVTVPVTDGVGTLTLPLTADHFPNVWLEVTVIHPVEPGNALTYPYASFAMLNLPVQDPGKSIAVSLVDLPEVIRPKTTLPVTVQSANGDGTPVAAEITLALVDEGIHQILDYSNPDPVAWFQRARRPDYRRAHYYDQVAYDFTGKPIGGGALLRKRLGEKDSTVDENWIKPLALWSGVVETDATGMATIPMEIPEFAGKVRLVVVATTGTKAGRVAANLTIRRPVVLQTTLPRFAAPGDTFDATVLLQNKGDLPVKTTLSLAATEPMHAEAQAQAWDIAGGNEVVTAVPLSVGEASGTGMLRWNVVSTDSADAPVDQFELETPLRVQAPSIFQTRSEIIVIPAGSQHEFLNTEFKENDHLESTLRVSSNPMLRLKEALDYVVGYPHGCLEQTVSRCLPLFLLGQNAKAIGSDWDARYFQQFVQVGIDRLFSMQTKGGGIGYWPGSDEAYPYGSVYAAHFLTLARQDAAFKVPQEAYDRLMGYVRDRIPLVPGEGYRSFYRYAYACYVRALAKDPQVMEDITSMDTLDVSTTARQWLALAMLTFTGDTQQTQAYLLNHPSTPYGDREQGDTLNSDIRNDAITLMTQVALKLDAQLVLPQMEKLIRYLESNRYSTQEAAFVITALADYGKAYTGDTQKARASIATSAGVEERSGDFQYNVKQKGPENRYTVANGGETPLYVHHTRAGILINPDVAAASSGITLTRHFENKDGIVADEALKHGETYLVALDIHCEEDLENVVLVNLLPGGLDIENPRLDGKGLAPWKKDDGVQPNYIDVRDDRLIAAFSRLKRGSNRYYVAVRTVSPGTFLYPGANAECMYDLQFNARTAGSRVTITK